MNESRLVYECMVELGKRGAVYRCNSGSVKLPNGKRFDALPKGFSDIMLVVDGGRVCFIECKAPGGKVSPDQERFVEKMQKLGARAGIAYSVADALEICGLDRVAGTS